MVEFLQKNVKFCFALLALLFFSVQSFYGQCGVTNTVTPGVISGNQTFCTSGNPIVFSGTAGSASGAGPFIITYQWQSSTDGSLFSDIVGANAQTYDATTVNQNTWFKRVDTSDDTVDVCAADTNTILVTIQSVPSAGSISGVQTICSGSTPAVLNSTGIGAGDGAISYEWQTNASGSYVTIGGAIAETYQPPALIATTSYQRRTVSTLNSVDCNSNYTAPVTITVEDTDDPTITCAADQSQTADAGVCTAAVTVVAPATADNCLVASVVNDFNGTADASDTYPLGTTTITWTVTDGVGNTASCTQDITVTDDENPTITCIADPTKSADAGACFYTVVGTEFDPTATGDNCGVATILNDFNGLATLADAEIPDGTVVTWTITDTSTLTADCSFTLTVTDDENPTISCISDPTKSADAGACFYTVVGTEFDPIATGDNCGIATILNDFNGLATLADAEIPDGTVVTWTITDTSALTVDCSFTVTVEDNENPVLSLAPNQDVNLDGSCEITIPNLVALSSATDNCSVTITQSQVAGSKVSALHNETIDVTVTATDGAGNIHQGVVVLTAKDITDPILTEEGDQTVTLDSSCMITIPNLVDGSSASDNCAGVVITQSPIAGTTQAAVHGDIIDVIVTATDAAGLTDQSTVELTVEDLNENVILSIIPSDLNTTICAGTEVTFEAEVAADGDPSALTYQWFLNGGIITGAINDTYITSSLVQGDNISLEMDYCSGSRTSNTINMTVNPLLTPGVQIVSSDLDNNICFGDSVTFSIFSLTNGGSNPTYQWQLDGVDIAGENAATYTTSVLNDAEGIQVVVTSNETCLAVNDVTSNEISTTVNSILTPSVSISADLNNICNGTLVTFEATPVNGGLNPAYQWKLNNVNVGSNSSTYVNSNLSNGDDVKVVMSPSNDICVDSSTEESNVITMNVTANETPTVSITTTNSIICAGESITFNSSNTWPGSTPTYQWQIDGADVGANIDNFTTSALADGQIVTLIMTSNYDCLTTSTANSNQLAITVNPLLTPSVSVVSSDADNKVCDSDSVTFTATPVNGGSNPSYQWKLNNGDVGTNSSTYVNSTWSNNDEVKVVMTPSSDECVNAATAESNSITTEVYSSLVAIPIIEDFSTAICYTASGTTISVPNDPNVTDYDWTVPSGFVISSGQGTDTIVINPTDLALDGDVTVTISNPCSPTQISAPVQITVGDFVYATAGADQIHCAGTTEITLNGDVDGAIGHHSQWDWSDDSGGTIVSPKKLNSKYQIPPGKVNGGTIVITMLTIEPEGDCGDAIVDTMTITILEPTTVVAGSYADVCQSSIPGAIVLGNASIEGGITQAAWSITSGDGTLSNTSLTSNPGAVTFTPDPDYSGTVELTLTSNNPGSCSAEVDTTNININALAVVDAGSDQVICELENVSLSGSISGGATTGTWTASSGVNAGLFDNDNSPSALYTPSATDISNGTVTLTFTAVDPIAPCATVSDNVIITVNQAPTVDAGDEKFICSIDTVTMTATLGGNVSSGTWSSSSGATSFDDINSPNAIYTPSATDISTGVVTLTYTTDDPDGAGPCSAVSDYVVVNISLASTVDVGIDDSICSNESYAVSAILAGGATSGIWSTSGGGNFDNAIVTDTNYNPSISDIANGSVTLTFTTTDAISPCSEISDFLDLEIKRAIEITSQPVNTGVCVSSPASFNVTAEGDDLEYQWYYTSNDTIVEDNAFISGSTTNTLNFLEASVGDAADYYVIVSSNNSECLEVRSSDVSLTVNQVVEIIVDLSSQAVCAGSTATFTVEAVGTISEYIWYYNDVEVARGADMTSYDIPNVSPANNGEYYVIIESAGNFCANISSLKADLTVREPVVITTQPVSQDICTDGDVTLSVVATGDISGYQWRKDGIDIVGATDPNYTVSTSGNYDVVITALDGACNGGFVTSNTAAITISPYPEGGILSFGPSERIFLICENPADGYAVPLTLSGQIGTVVKWEYRTSAAASWTVIPDGGGGDYTGTVLSATQIEDLIITESTVFRVEVMSGACLPNAFSETAIISVIPSDIVPSPVQVSEDVICIGDSVLLSSETGYGEEFGKFEGGDFDNASIDDSNTWRIKDGDGNIQNFETSADNTRPDIWLRATPHDFITADYDTPPYTVSEERWDGSFDSEGNKGFAIVSGDNPSTMETPIFALAGLDEAILTFDQAYNLTPGATIMVEISTNGGDDYDIEPILFQMDGAATSENYDHFGEGTPGINQMQIDLGEYLGYSDLRIRFNYSGTRDGDVWALDNIKVPEGPRDVALEWWDTTVPGDSIFIGNSNNETWTPTKIGWNVFVVQTLLILDSQGNTCPSLQNSEEIRVFAFDQYNTSVASSSGGCGIATVDLSATVTASQQGVITSYPTPDGYIGQWDIQGPVGGSLTNTDPSSLLLPINNPNATFTGLDGGSYTFSWILVATEEDEYGVVFENTGCLPVVSSIDLDLGPCSTLDFDGVDDYVHLGTSYAGNNSVEAWIRPEATTGTIFSTPNFEIKMSDLPATVIPNTRWYHVAVSNGKLYVDGIEIGNAGSDNGGSKTLIGARWDDSSGEPENYFSGWIEEVRIWNIPITQEQIRFMMNQHLQDAAFMGVEIPIAVPGGLLYTDLAGYYRLISADPDPANLVTFPNALMPSNGETPDLANTAVPGILYNMTTHQQNTAPMPYTSENDGDWDVMSTWTRPVVWDYPNSTGIDITPIEWNIVVSNHNINSTAKDITLLGLIVESGELTIADPSDGLDENNGGQGLWITHYLELDGNIDLIGESQLVQKRYTPSQFSESILDQDSGGYIERDQQGTQSSFNYNYWSSTVGPISGNMSARGTGVSSTNAAYTISNILMDGTNSSSPNGAGTISYNGAYAWADIGLQSPIRLSDYWFWTFNGASGVYADWKHVGSYGQIQPGEGYTMKGTSGDAAISVNQNYVFKGKPFNGDVNLYINAGDNVLVGNPYPSAIDAREFILDHISVNGGRNTKNVINGTLYFWHHFSGHTHILREYEGGYATYNLMGGAVASSYDYRIKQTYESGSKAPGHYIPVNQGFFVNSSIDTELGDLSVTPVVGGDIIFENSQRIFQREDGTNSLFIKGKKSKAEYVDGPVRLEGEVDLRPKIRLQYDSPLGYRRNLLVGADVNASDNFDLGYDGPLNESNEEDMYWFFLENSFVIQGIQQFTPEKELPLGIRVKEAGKIRIKLEALENIPEDVELYIKDNYNDGATYDIKNSSGFEIDLEPGEYKDRFSLVFQSRLDRISEIAKIEDGVTIYMNNTDKQIVIQKTAELDFVQATLYNYLGQIIKSWDKGMNVRELILPVSQVSTGVYIISLQTEQGLISKKLLIE